MSSLSPWLSSLKGVFYSFFGTLSRVFYGRNSGVTINNLLEDVLLEVFDAYRRDIELLPRYENIWNSRDGWFKLAHVCTRWRRLVFLSPTRLHVHLLFTPRRSSRVIMLKQLPPFPILVDYHAASWTERIEDLALAALRPRNRVRGISLRRPTIDTVKLLRSLNRPFPELESVDISPPGHGQLILPANFLSDSLPRLRRLTLRGVVPSCLSPLLSLTTGLVELNLTLNIMFDLVPLSEYSLLPILQRLSCLRRLYLDYDSFRTNPPAPAGEEVVVPLPKLTHFIFRGHRLYLEALTVGLVAPSLQHLDAELSGQSNSAFPILRLCKFICNSECQFTTIRLGFSDLKLKFYAGTSSESIDDQPFRIIVPGLDSLEQMGQELSAPFSTVEELIITLGPFFLPNKADQLRGFFNHVPRVKIMQISAWEAESIASSFQKDGQEPAIDLLPALEQIKVDMGHQEWGKTTRGAFEPLIAAWKRVGRSIIVSWI